MNIKAKNFKTSPIILALTVVLSFSSLHFLAPHIEKPIIKIDHQKEAFNIDPKVINFLSIGQQRPISSFFWVMTLLQSDLKHYDSFDLKSWMYLRFHTVLTLTPYFYKAYLYGAIYLSIVKDDETGAARIYERGVEKYPHDYELLFNAGFHYYTELNNIPKAIHYFERALNISTKNIFLPTLLGRLKAGEENIESAKVLLETTLSKVPYNGPIAKRVKRSLYAIYAEIDLKCLNEKKNESSCRLYDFYGEPYLKRGQQYYARLPWKPFRLKKKGATK